MKAKSNKKWPESKFWRLNWLTEPIFLFKMKQKAQRGNLLLFFALFFVPNPPSSLDELPQLFNVLTGSMSLIGPRPPVVYHPYDGYENYPDWAKKRFEMRPGMTGLVQCTIRNSASLDGTALPLTKELIYEYDYGDGWEVRIVLEDIYDYSSLKDKNSETINEELKEKIESVIAHYIPICIESDGLPVMDDVGGVGGYCTFLEDVFGKQSGEDARELREWARMQGWTGRISRPEKML